MHTTLLLLALAAPPQAPRPPQAPPVPAGFTERPAAAVGPAVGTGAAPPPAYHPFTQGVIPPPQTFAPTFLQPAPPLFTYPAPAVAGPPFHAGHRCPACGRTVLRVAGPGPVPGSHLHVCPADGTAWFH